MWIDRNAILIVFAIAALGAAFGALVTMTVCAPQVF
jgi:hypothetical protein